MAEISVKEAADLLAELDKKGKAYGQNLTLTVADRHLAVLGQRPDGKNWYSPVIALYHPTKAERLAHKIKEGVEQAEKYLQRFKPPKKKTTKSAVRAEKQKKDATATTESTTVANG